MLSTTPTALMKTTSEVEPALINGSGSPVGGIEPVMTFYCTKKEQLACSLNLIILFRNFLFDCHIFLQFLSNTSLSVFYDILRMPFYIHHQIYLT